MILILNIIIIIECFYFVIFLYLFSTFYVDMILVLFTLHWVLPSSFCNKRLVVCCFDDGEDDIDDNDDDMLF